MPRTTEDTDGNKDKAETTEARPTETTTRKHGKKKEWGAENGGEYLTTWASHDGNIGSQIDYTMVNAKYRNAVRKAQNNIY